MSHSLTPAQRFWRKVEKTEGCWIWKGGRHPLRGGYGVFMRDATHEVRAHRFAYELTHLEDGPIPPGVSVLHSCDNPPCVNPAHLRLGTHLDNSRDARERGRPIGRPRRLTEETVQTIRRAIELGARTKDVAALYGVHRMTVQRAVRRA